MKKYSLGLDIGTNSIGWAVVDENNELVTKNGFTFWGVRMFDEAKTAAERRSYRSARRMLARRKKRILLLQNEFYSEIEKVDKNFFQRINDSFLKQEDKLLNNHYTYFDDIKTDKDFFEKFPTIYHLRKYLMETKEKADIRYVYLALHHIVKYRGHFLNEGNSFESNDFKTIIDTFKEINNVLVQMALYDEDNSDYYMPINNQTIDNTFVKRFIEICNDEHETKKDKELNLIKLFSVEKNSFAHELIISLILSNKKDISKLSFIKEKEYDKLEIDFNSEDYEDNIEKIRNDIPELNLFCDEFSNIKVIVDYLYLVNLLGDSNTLSDSMIKIYDNHHQQLKELKLFVKKYIPDKYFECFRKVDAKINNYAKYVGMNSSNSQNEKRRSRVRFEHCSQDEFYAYIKKLLVKVDNPDAEKEKEYILNEINRGDYLLRQNSSHNSAIPMQLNLYELNKILDNQSEYYAFLNNFDGKYTAKERIKLIFEYHIPYYVGPLGKTDKGWLVKNEDKYVTPFNYKEVIDFDETAKIFIQRMQNKCQYLHGESDYCLPKYSLLFSEYNVLSYLNKLKINGALISKELKDMIYNDVFLKNSKPRKKDIINYLAAKENFNNDLNSTIPEVTCDMSSYIKFKEIFGDDFSQNYDKIEEIIKDITIFEDKKILEKRLYEIYDLDEQKIKVIKGLNYKGYGALSRHLLANLQPYYQVSNDNTGEIYNSIINIMRDTNLNLQEILYSDEYDYMKVIDEYNKNQMKEDNNDFVPFIDENLYVSPMMKRALIQSYILICEIEKILGKSIDKYYVECARSNKAKKEETKSRANKMIDLYKKCIEEAPKFSNYLVNDNDLKIKLNELDKNSGLSDKMYLYFTQLGKCMYTGKTINISELDKYDIDHIYPQSIIKDDSLSNRVLVEKHFNQGIKKDNFLFELSEFNLESMEPFYRKLLEKGFISKEKYRRLTQREMTSNELEGFVNRQIVSTNQAVKGLVQLLKLYKGVNDNDIVYSKGEIISDFRMKYDAYLRKYNNLDSDEIENNIHYDFWKSREANNYHHAHDAYLNVVIGRTIKNYYEFHHFKNVKDLAKLKADKISINPLTILSKDRKYYSNGKEVVIWDRKKTLALLNKNIKTRFDINETVMTTTSAELFAKVSIKPVNKGTVPAKLNLPIEKYGGIDSYKYCKYCIVKLIDKRNKVSYSLEAIPGAFKDKIDTYLKEIINKNKYVKYEIMHPNIKTNCVVNEDSKYYYITGKTGDNYYKKNAIDRNFDYNHIKTIKKITKYFENIKFDINMEQNSIIVSKNSKQQTTIELYEKECDDLFNDIMNKYTKKIYAYSNIKAIVDKQCKYYQLNIEEKVKVLSELLKLLKTNERSSANLSLLGLASSAGILTMSKSLNSGMKFIAYSITGYYKKVLFEVPSGI